jgi:transcriptional regulator with GAF, ATPase, and Fis domain
LLVTAETITCPTKGQVMEPFNDRDTISAPIGEEHGSAKQPEPIEALRVLGSRRELELPAGRRITIGASPRCDVVVDDPYASARHCVLERHDERVVVRDWRSKNGTLLNGNLVESAVLRAGAILSVGRTRLVALGTHGRGSVTAYERLRGQDPAFRAAVDVAIRAASADCSVLILGETGTGKELVARAIHDASPRCGARFVAMNCGAVSANLSGSELFGHSKGAFTGAVRDRDGAFVRADGGTLFLDELAELPVDQQPLLLRVVEDHYVRPLGDDRERRVDVRLVAATNRSEALGTPRSPLRVDLYHRLATVVVDLPPLRERPGDVPILAGHFLDELAGEHGRRVIPRTAMRALASYQWPGNVRELRNAIHRAVTLCSRELTVDKLFLGGPGQRPPMTPLPTRQATRIRDRGAAPAQGGLGIFDLSSRDLILDYLDRYGSIRRAAAAMGVPKSTLCDRARRLGIRVMGRNKYGVGE